MLCEKKINKVSVFFVIYLHTFEHFTILTKTKYIYIYWTEKIDFGIGQKLSWTDPRWWSLTVRRSKSSNTNKYGKNSIYKLCYDKLLDFGHKLGYPQREMASAESSWYSVTMRRWTYTFRSLKNVGILAFVKKNCHLLVSSYILKYFNLEDTLILVRNLGIPMVNWHQLNLVKLYILKPWACGDTSICESKVSLFTQFLHKYFDIEKTRVPASRGR